ncbi:MAG: hypothetical protein A2511_17070 [Deltaproteobacteria bacterium RIFOXYD12_FULL_50_9]|nr:MAG: hypothetical protein A2511_17070 [Deltaproteobacteria bacterium RIFOXYD12_FULL_50_9]
MHNPSIKNKIIVPVCICLLIAIVVPIIGINMVVRKNISKNANEIFDTTQKMLTHHIEEDAAKIHVMLNYIAENPELQKSWLAQDRQRLYEQSLPLFNDMRNNYGISHFYFHQPNGINFLRVHHPQKHGDPIERYTLRETKKQEKAVHGIELGPLGTLTLRVVLPWVINGRVTGYIELGEELPHITKHLKDVLRVDFVLAINKSLLSRDGWDEGRRMLNKQADLQPWETLSDMVVIDITLLMDKDNLLRIFGKLYEKGSFADKTLTLNNHIYQVRTFPFSDAVGMNLGDFHVLYDTTAELSSLREITIINFTTAIMLGVLLTVFFYRYLGRLEKSINRDQQLIKQQHEEAQAINEQLKGEIMERQQTEDWLERSYQTTATINKIQHLSLESENMDELLHEFIACVVSLPWLSLEPQGAIFLIEDDPEVLVLKAFKGLAVPLQQKCARLPFGVCLCGRAAVSRKVVFANHVDERHDIGFDGMHPHGHYCIPILSADKKLLGVFTLYIKEGSWRDENAEAILQAAASSVAGTIERLQGALVRVGLEKKLLQAQKMEAIGTLAGGIAHDFNNILTPILGYAEMVLETLPSQSVEHEDQLMIIEGALRAKDLVRQILLFSRQTEQEQGPVEVKLVAKEVIKLLRSSLPANIEIHQNISPQRSMVLADPTQIYQVIMNLCTNAYHAMLVNGGILGVALSHVDLEAGAIRDNKSELSPGSYLKLEVSDTGHGMDQKIMERIFEPYFTTKPFGDGTGLGLAVVHGIVKNFGGLITVYSEPNKGSTFHVYLPLIDFSDDLSEHKIVSPLPTGTERILVVDDRMEIVRYEQQLLTSLGYKVTSFTDSVAAFEAFSVHPDDFDLVITDMNMPKLTGSELTQRILALKKAMPIILCTGFSELINQEKAKAIGIKGYIMKPIISRQFTQVIRDILDDKDRQ